MSLHLLFSSPGHGDVVDRCLRALLPGDTLLLLGEGVYALAPGSSACQAVAALPASVAVRAIAVDCAERGLHELPDRVACIDYAGFVALACADARSVSWS